MNLALVKENLLKLGEKIGLQVHEEVKDRIILHAQMRAEEYFKNSIYLRIVAFSSGTLHIFFTFDPIEKTYDNLFLINYFNANSPWFRAYIANINDKDYLELHYSTTGLQKEEEMINSIGYMLNNLISDETYKDLKPILQNN